MVLKSKNEDNDLSLSPHVNKYMKTSILPLLDNKRESYIPVTEISNLLNKVIINNKPFIAPEKFDAYVTSVLYDFQSTILHSKPIQKNFELSDLLVIVYAMMDAMDISLGDCSLKKHNYRVGTYAYKICESLNLPKKETDMITFAGRSHDIGKLFIPFYILKKPSKLDYTEMGIIKTHAYKGAQFMKDLSSIYNLELNRIITESIADHHENYDGRGYPSGKCGDELSLGAQIIAATDSFDAMTSKRAYSCPMKPLAAVLELKKDSRHNPELIDKIKFSLIATYLSFSNN